MLKGRAYEAAQSLIQARAQSLGQDWEAILRQHETSTQKQLLQLLKNAPQHQYPALGLLLAKITLKGAVSNSTNAQLDKFLFRFGAHLKKSTSANGITPAQSAVLSFAAEKALNATPVTPRRMLESVSDTTRHLNQSSLSDSDWLQTVGLTTSEYVEHINVVSQKPANNGNELSENSNTHAVIGEQIAEAPLPHWLEADFTHSFDPLVSSTANWDPSRFAESNTLDVSSAWRKFVSGDFAGSQRDIVGLYHGLGTRWGPTSTTNSLRVWHWIRLVHELCCLQSGKAADRRRSATSAFELAYRCLSDNNAILDKLLIEALDDFKPSDPATTRAWCAYTVRLAACIGHERALEIYDNAQKAQLRREWSKHFESIGAPLGSTAAMSQSLCTAFREIHQRLYVSSRDDTNSSAALRSISRRIALFIDESESMLFTDATELIAESTSGIEDGSYNHSELVERQMTLSTIRAKISLSHSLILQDLLGPHIAKLNAQLEEAKERLGNISRPDISARLESARLPFSATPGTLYPIRIVVSNSGNTQAERIQIRVLSSELGINAIGDLDHLGVGAEDVVEVQVTSTSSTVSAAALTCEMSWSDAALQQFDSSVTLAAEDQRPAAWTDSDINPFSLGTISDPSRLVGRGDDLASLEALIAGGGSAYVTGHKRVGKTSLTRVLIEQTLRERGWAGAIFSLGRALGPEQLAEDLVYTLMEEIYAAVCITYPDAAAKLEEFQPDPKGNFARSANRWLRAVARFIPQDARVTIAVDDFDELPSHLVSGKQADGLFLFLRSLVDERWLNLIVVGSEVLPSVIQSQAHKLNQVVPVSVTNFSSRSATAALLTTPTREHLEWDPTSIDRVHHVCRGNPYYETLLAHQLWDDLREQSRSFVTIGDVDHAANVLAKTAPNSHFVHLWADSTSGIDHTSRRAIVTSAVLRAVARCGGAQLEPSQTSEVISVAQTWIQTATAAELQGVISSLLDREVLERGPAEASLLISIPLVAIWMTQAGARELEREYAKSSHATETVKLVTDSDLVSISRNLVYKGEAISEIRIRDWLRQFGDNYHQHLAYRLLRRMVKDGYFTSSRLNEQIMPRLREAISESSAARLIARDNNGYMQNGYLIKHGRAGDSTQGAISWLCKGMKIKKANILSPEEILPSKVRLRDPGALIFVLDDYCGTGGHLEEIVEQVIEYLPGLGDDWRDGVHLVVGAGVVSDLERLKFFPDSGLIIESVAGLELGSRFRPFNTDSGVFDSDDERHDAEDMLTTIGRALLKNNPLGYGGDALLTLLEFNCPNNAPPVFWRSGTYGGKPWYPLFERTT